MHQTAFNPPIWWLKWFIPISAGLVALQAIADLLKEIIKKDLKTVAKIFEGVYSELLSAK